MHKRDSKLASHRRRLSRGMTIIEIGIVLVILAFLVAGIIAGQDLITAAKVRSIVSEIERYDSATNLFTERFRAFPGDMPNASTFFKDPITAANLPNGDGDGRIEYSGGTDPEGNLAWRHLAAAKLVEGSYDGSLDAIVNVSVPDSKSAGGGAGYAYNYDDTLGNHLILGLADGIGIIDTPSLTPQFAYSVDKKLDDGIPDAGNIRGAEEDIGACFVTNTTPHSYEYETETLECYLQIKLQ